jgi:AcrR family transcriptional regulator
VLETIGLHPGASNRAIAGCAGIRDDAQISRLLARLEERGLIVSQRRHAVGNPHAWALTESGREAMRGIERRLPAEAACGPVAPPRPPGRSGRYHHAARRLLRNMLLDATAEELERRSWPDLAMCDVALRTGVGRTMIYQEFGSRQELGRALVERETANAALLACELLLSDPNHPSRAIGAALSELQRLVESSFGQSLLRPQIEAGDESAPAFAALADLRPALVGACARAWAWAPPDTLEPLADALLRLTVSYLLHPQTGPADAEGVAAALAMCVPASPSAARASRPSTTEGRRTRRRTRGLAAAGGVAAAGQ